jgi:hypothetical protein
MSNSLIDECRTDFEAWSKHKDYRDDWFVWRAWKAARDHYAPKLTEDQAIKIAYKASIDRWRNDPAYATEAGWEGYLAEIIDALKIAGMQFKPNTSEGT